MRLKLRFQQVNKDSHSACSASWFAFRTWRRVASPLHIALSECNTRPALARKWLLRAALYGIAAADCCRARAGLRPTRQPWVIGEVLPTAAANFVTDRRDLIFRWCLRPAPVPGGRIVLMSVFVRLGLPENRSLLEQSSTIWHGSRQTIDCCVLYYAPADWLCSH